MKRLSLASVAWLVASCPSWANSQEERFVEFRYVSATTTYDLSTGQMITPGRFTIISTRIDTPDVMQFELKVTDTLSAYCTRHRGKYPPPLDFLTLGPADMPLEDIEVARSMVAPVVVWRYPYKRLAIVTTGGLDEGIGMAFCKGNPDSEQAQMDHRSGIMNGSRRKEIFDCQRGVSGFFLAENDKKPLFTGIVSNQSSILPPLDVYARVCYGVTHEVPYLPK
jgi:hypothetical protein